MNHYYYLSIMSDSVTCNGESFGNILKTVDQDLYTECLTETDKIKITGLFKRKQLPLGIIVVSNEDGFYELATESTVTVRSVGEIIPYAVSGDDVVDIFINEPNYSDYVFNMMETYNKKKHSCKGFFKVKK